MTTKELLKPMKYNNEDPQIKNFWNATWVGYAAMIFAFLITIIHRYC